MATKSAPDITKEVGLNSVCVRLMLSSFIKDLLCEEPTSSFWRGMAEKLEKEIDDGLETSFNVCFSLRGVSRRCMHS